MVKALILYSDGRREVKDVKGLKMYQTIVEGNIEALAMISGYVNPEKISNKYKRSELFGYVNEEGMIRELPANPYASILSILGMQLAFPSCLYGNIILFSYNSQTGKKSAIDSYIIKLFDDFEVCEDENEFLAALTHLNNPRSKK